MQEATASPKAMLCCPCFSVTPVECRWALPSKAGACKAKALLHARCTPSTLVTPGKGVFLSTRQPLDPYISKQRTCRHPVSCLTPSNPDPFSTMQLALLSCTMHGSGVFAWHGLVQSIQAVAGQVFPASGSSALSVPPASFGCVQVRCKAPIPSESRGHLQR